MLQQSFSKRIPAGWMIARNTGEELVLKRLPLLPPARPTAGLVELKLRPRSPSNRNGHMPFVYYLGSNGEGHQFKQTRYVGFKPPYAQWKVLESDSVEFMKKVNSNISKIRKSHVKFSVQNVVLKKAKQLECWDGKRIRMTRQLENEILGETGVRVNPYAPSLFKTTIHESRKWDMQRIFPEGCEMPSVFVPEMRKSRIELLSDWHPVKQMPQILDYFIAQRIIPNLSSIIR